MMPTKALISSTLVVAGVVGLALSLDVSLHCRVRHQGLRREALEL